MTEHTVRKAIRLLTSGNVRVLEACTEQGTLFAQVRGDNGTYLVSHDYPAPGWNCECAAHRLGHSRCSHIEALAAIWAPEAPAKLHAV